MIYICTNNAMLCIYHHSTDPYFNIATDEYIFKHLKEDCFMLWQNDNAIIVGKHQNTLAEINAPNKTTRKSKNKSLRAIFTDCSTKNHRMQFVTAKRPSLRGSLRGTIDHA